MDKEKIIIPKNEVDLGKLFKEFWKKRKFISYVTGVFLVIGILVAFTSKVEYQASCKLLSENQGSTIPNIGGLASLTGFNIPISKNSEQLSPKLFPEIIKSVPFQLDLIHEPIHFQILDSTMSSFIYFTHIASPSIFEQMTITSILGKIKNVFSKKIEEKTEEKIDILHVLPKEWSVIQNLRERFKIEVTAKTGVIEVTTEMPDFYAAAQMTNILVKKLTAEVISYKTEKTKTNLFFIKDRYNECKTAYEKKQKILARYSDRNKNLSSSLVRIEYQRLQNDMDIAFEVYKNLASQLEQAKIKVKEETPVFKILDPVTLQQNPIKPKKKLIIFIFILVGMMSAIITILVKKLMKLVIQKEDKKLL